MFWWEMETDWKSPHYISVFVPSPSLYYHHIWVTELEHQFFWKIITCQRNCCSEGISKILKDSSNHQVAQFKKKKKDFKFKVLRKIIWTHTIPEQLAFNMFH